MANRQRNRNPITSKPDLVSTNLIYPVTLTSDATKTSGGMQITGNQFAPVAQQVFEVQDSAGNIIYTVPLDGGPKTSNTNWRVYHTSGQSYGGLNGTDDPPSIELPDGTGSQGSKIWSGSGAPTAATVGTAAVGDIYYCRCASALVAASQATSTGASIQIGTGTLTSTTKILDSTPVAGDLLIVCSGNTNATETMTIGADAAVTATATDGGITQNDGTNYVKFFSHVIQSGDISSGKITITSSSHTTGTGRSICAAIFHNDDGWTTTGSLHGCATYATDGANTASGGANVTRTITGPSSPSVFVTGMYASGINASHSLTWDAEDASNGAAAAIVSSFAGGSRTNFDTKPGTGLNTSGVPGFNTGGSSVIFSSLVSGAKVTLMSCWKPNGTTIPIMYVCTIAGTPGTWSKII